MQEKVAAPKKPKAKPNKGEPKVQVKKVVTQESPDEYDRMVDDMGQALNLAKQVQFCIGAIPFKSGINIMHFSEILGPFEKDMAAKFSLVDIRQEKFNEPIKALCNKKEEILAECKKYDYVFVDERDPVQDMIFRCLDSGEFIVWRSIVR